MSDKVHIIQVVKHSTIEQTGDRITFAQFDKELPDWEPNPVPVSEAMVHTTMRDVQTLPLLDGKVIHVCLADDNTEELLQSVLAHISRLTGMYMQADQDARFNRKKWVETEAKLDKYRALMKRIKSEMVDASFFTRLKYLFRIQKFKFIKHFTEK